MDRISRFARERFFSLDEISRAKIVPVSITGQSWGSNTIRTVQAVSEEQTLHGTMAAGLAVDAVLSLGGSAVLSLLLIFIASCSS
jgi:hypothetical protein